MNINLNNLDFIIICLVILLFLFISVKEKFTQFNDNFIDYRVIYMKTNNNMDRLNQINLMQEKLGKKLNFFDAVVGKNVNLNKLDVYDPNITLNFKYKYIGEIGCYLSHYMLIKEAINSPYSYTVVFEDDFNISDNNFNEKLTKSLKTLENMNINFDMLYLGNILENKGEPITDNIYRASKTTQLLGTHAYLINNKSAKKILSNLNNIDCAIDHKFSRSNMTNKIDVLVFNPSIIKANGDLISIIHPENKAF